MLAFLRRLLAVPQPSVPLAKALYALEDRVEALEGRREKDRAEFKELRGFAYALKRGSKEPTEALPVEKGSQLDLDHSPRASVPSTGHLARRFKIGG